MLEIGSLKLKRIGLSRSKGSNYQIFVNLESDIVFLLLCVRIQTKTVYCLIESFENALDNYIPCFDSRSFLWLWKKISRNMIFPRSFTKFSCLLTRNKEFNCSMKKSNLSVCVKPLLIGHFLKVALKNSLIRNKLKCRLYKF